MIAESFGINGFRFLQYPVKERGDVLVFLSGINEITTMVEAATAYAEKTRKWIILSLHSSLSLAEQDKVSDLLIFHSKDDSSIQLNKHLLTSGFRHCS
jgi:hypothetical protein